MDKEFIEIEQAIKESDSQLTELLKKRDNIKNAIKTFEDENIALPESAYGLLNYYQSKFNDESKAYQQLVGLRNRMKINCKHEYVLSNDERYQECKHCGDKRYITSKINL